MHRGATRHSVVPRSAFRRACLANGGDGGILGTVTAVLERRSSTDADRAAMARTLAGVAFGPSIASAAIATALVLVTLVAAGSDLTDVGASAAATWLAAHQVPLTIAGSPLSVLPLLPTGLLVWSTFRSTAAAVGEDARWVLAAALSGPVIVVVLALTLIHGFAGAVPLAGPPVVPTVLIVVGVHLLGAVLGLAQRSTLRERVRRRLPTWAADGAMLVPRVLRRLAVGAAVVTVVCLVCSLPAAGDLVGGGGGLTGGLALVLVSLAYLPNVVIGALSVSVGPGAVLGQTTVTAFGAVHAPLPALPVLAAVPQGDGSWWWLAVLLVPASAAVSLGRTAACHHADRTEALRAVGTAAVLVGVVLAVLGAMAGGTLGAGAMSPVSVPPLAFGAVGAVWLAAVGSAAVLTLRWRSAEVTAEDETASIDD